MLKILNFGIAGYRVGPYAAGGTPFFTGYIDYLKLLNERDGGLNKVNITWEECDLNITLLRALNAMKGLKQEVKLALLLSTQCLQALLGLMDKAPKDDPFDYTWLEN